jgi:thioredoxin reductase
MTEVSDPLNEKLNCKYDVLVVGGGAAGLNGALMLARSRRSVAVIDAGRPRNAPADAVHGLLARDGMPPAELLERGRAEVRGYGGHVVSGEVTAVTRLPEAEGFNITLADGRSTQARRLLVTIGLIDELPDVAGLAEAWGHDVIHCPYCHGWEARDKAIGVLGAGPMSLHQALLFRQLSDDIVLFTHTMPPLTDDQRDQLAARDIPIVDGQVTAWDPKGVRLADGTLVPRDVLAIGARFKLQADFLSDLDLHPVEHPTGFGDHLPADPTGRSTAPGVWLAGNVTDPSAQVGAAAAAGAWSAAQINADLVAEETQQAVAARAAKA